MPRFLHTLRTAALLAACSALVAGCDGDDPVDPDPGVTTNLCANAPGGSGGLAIAGCGRVTNRFTAELFVRGNTAYTTTWGERDLARGNAIFVWDVAGDAPQLVDSVIVASGATTLGDVAVSDDGRWLVVAAEPGPLSLLVYDLANPRKPVEVGRWVGNAGGHTAEIGTVNGRLHAFVSLNRTLSTAARLAIVDLGTPAQPREVHSRPLPTTIIHDSFYRDGLLFLNLWDEGLTILDVGGGGRGGTLAAPVDLGRVATVGGNAHNAWWFHDPQGSQKRYVFVGEEQAGGVPVGSAGDIHVVDVTNLAQPREVAFYTVPSAGTHNFSVDEARGVLYAAYYNGGVRAIDVRGDLGTCTAAQKSLDGRCDLGRMGRELGSVLQGTSGLQGFEPPYIWGVHYQANFVYASDMVNGLWKLRAVQR
ncbi:MAG TPA: hypothetical protein VEA99_10290 [Gemmatimonadaceae bacterium]|nr:hypothetical protein [Gemmatimonadaceae bacterium]